MQAKKPKNLRFSKSFGSRLRKLRKEKNLTQSQFAKKIGFIQSASVSNIESGKSSPDIQTLFEMAKALDADLHWLITGKQSPEGKHAKEIAHSALMRIAGYFAIELGHVLRQQEYDKAELVELLKKQEAGEDVDIGLIDTLRFSIASGEKSLKQLAEDQPWVQQALENIGYPVNKNKT